LLLEIVKIQGQLMASLPTGAREVLVRHFDSVADRPLWFLEDPTLHPILKESMLEFMRADACLLAVTYALIANRRPEPWLSLAMADIIYAGSYRRLVLVASIPAMSAVVPVEVVPLADRLDMKALDEETKATEAWLRKFASSADTDELYPFARSDD
jgi:hypothetical protein